MLLWSNINQSRAFLLEGLYYDLSSKSLSVINDHTLSATKDFFS